VGRNARILPLLDADHAAFIGGGVSIVAASSGLANVPSLERAVGCKVSSDRRRVTVFVAATSARGLLEDVRRSGRIAVVFTEPSTHRTIQLKGKDAAVVPAAAADQRIVAAYAEAITSVLAGVGREVLVVRALLAYPHGDLRAIAFTPIAAFTQTPGPQAGTPIKS
jgi:hypothetical protein